MPPRFITLVRHGETLGESSIRYHGANDVALSPHGIEQMRCVARTLRGEAFDLALTSTLQRSTEAARIIAPHLPASALADFDEVNFGDWEGLTAAEIEARDAELFLRWRADFAAFSYPGGDSVLGFRRRVTAAFAARYPELPERLLIVAHKGVIATLLAYLLDEPLEQHTDRAIDLGSIHFIERKEPHWGVLVANRTDHLDQAHPTRPVLDSD